MPSNRSDVEKTTTNGELPIMPTQAIIIGTVLAIGAISCSGFYLSMLGGSVALVPWMCVVLFVAVAFTYVVGFALLWCAESFTLRMKERFRALAYGVVGFIGYGVWGLLVMTSLMNSIGQPLNGVVLSNGSVLAVALNYAVFGFLAFMLGQLLAPKLCVKKPLAFGLLAAQIVLAVFGLIAMVMMFGALYR
ncbi:cadmium transporter [Bifidobacterium sp. 64T4]|uniref:cadmium transporter n=1 Tax=Bifidobacterium pongonis TaxID=2834432 RepID=UPI001C597BCF|nr:cadmium transporter [Bifidobacterium pongonis]MBW3095214.1 cadmium transporter [Bifidobacterium pongonis]